MIDTDLSQAIKLRHSVRSYTDKEIEKKTKEDLISFIDDCNKESGLHMQLVLNEPNAFDSFAAHYGKFRGVKNYIAVVGKKGGDLDEKCGYYGERVVLYAQMLGLNTCWVALTYSKKKAEFEVAKDEKLCLVISVGYGVKQGRPHKSKPLESVIKADAKTDELPEWFLSGVEAALLAPTAINQQKFVFVLKGDTVEAKAGLGFYAKVDLGIVKYHFEVGAGTDNFRWG